MKYIAFISLLALIFGFGYAPSSEKDDFGEAYRQVDNNAFSEGEKTSYLIHYGLIDAGIANANSRGRSVAGTYPAPVVGAMWNFVSIVEDQSGGVHNGKYAKTLLQNSIDAISP